MICISSERYNLYLQYYIVYIVLIFLCTLKIYKQVSVDLIKPQINYFLMFYCMYIYDLHINRKVFFIREILWYFYEFIYNTPDVEGETP